MRTGLITAAFAAVAAAGSALTLISIADEIQLGRRTQQQVQQQVPQVADRQVTNYVASIGKRLAARTEGPRYPYSFSVANYREINAFALPGGPVWIHRGAISAAANEAQVAAVLAHEVAHIARRHAASKITKSLVANGLIGLLGAALGNDRSARNAQAGARILAGGYMLKFSRDDEREADRVGAAILRRAGWDAREMVTFMEMLRRQQENDPGTVEVFLSSHPAATERAELLRRTIRGGGGTKNTEAFRTIKARLAKMPSAPPMRR